MRKVVYSTMATVDGFTETPEGGLDWVIIDDELHSFVNDNERESETYVYGRKMYQLMEDYWPTADQDPNEPPVIHEFSRIYKRMEKLVFSTTLDRVGDRATLFRGDPAGEVARLKQQSGGDIRLGGTILAGEVERAGLIDEYEIYIHPVVLGAGTRMFAGLASPRSLRLLNTRRFSSGVVFLHYQRI